MTVRNLEGMFSPRSVALVGASPEPGSVGATVARNLLRGGFKGRIDFVNPKHREILGRPCHPSVAALPETPDLAVVATPPAAVPGVVAALAEKGARAAAVITAGVGALAKPMLEAARPGCLRILGPNCLGLMVPGIGLDASFAHRAAPAGDLAFISQSGALLTAVVDWAAGRGIGFSHVVSLGEMADADFGDLLDYLAGDASSRAILLYMEAVTAAPKFLSAARRAARVKPVVVVKSGRHEAGRRAAMSHTGALAGSDAAYDAAFRRTGLLRVATLPDLFAAAEVLARVPRLEGERLAILTNGGGAGVLAADELQDAHGVPAVLSPGTLAALDAVLPPTWSRGNPVDIIGDAGPERYRAALSALLEDPENDAILAIQCPTAIASATEAAEAVIQTIAAARAGGRMKPVLANWLGEDAPREARALFSANGIPSFDTPSAAVTGFTQLVRHARAQRELAATPPVLEGGACDPEAAARVIAEALAGGRTALTAIEAKTVLAAYGIPVVESRVARDPAEVRAAAEALLAGHTACVVKILSRDITHKSDVGGVRVGLETGAAAEGAAREMLARVAKARPEARVEGFMVEPMIRRPNAHETIVGASVDRTFGPMILFGAGGTAVEVIQDSALALPPLDMLLARHLIAETRIARLLAGYRDRPPADIGALAGILARASDLLVRHAEIRELDINPVLVDENGAIALDARIAIADPARAPRPPLAIRPYPSEWRRLFEISGFGEIEARPVRPEDEPLYRPFFAKVTPEDIRLRFFTARGDFSHRFLATLTQIDYAREMAFVAVSRETGEMLGVVRMLLDPDRERGEYGVLVRSDLHGRGLGWRLMTLLIDYARGEGVRELTGLVLAENITMLKMARELGFAAHPVAGDASVREVVLDLSRG